MGIEPTSEAWEAQFGVGKRFGLAAILRFSTFLKWIPIGAAFELAAVYLANRFQTGFLANKIVALGIAIELGQVIMVYW